MAALLTAAVLNELACYGCFISQMELFYRIWKDEGEEAGRKAYSLSLRLPISWLHESAELLEQASAIKACFPVSLADAWIAAAALQLDAELVHKDPEFEKVDNLKQERLPYK